MATVPSSVLAGTDPITLASGAVLAGRYEIAREIGRGGYSIVYQARDRTVGTDVAIKLLVPPPVIARLARERMRREVQAVRELSHENIVGVYDLLEEEARSFIVMEYVAGPDLQGRVVSGGPLTVPQLESVGKGIASALAAAHRQGILHRDVKPQNILLAPDGRARLTDFGSARLDGQATVTQTGGLVGTLAYAAPELLAGQRGDARSDVYSLGMTLFYAATATLPPGSSPHLPAPAVPGGHHARVVRRDIPEWLDGVIARATAADPRDRFPGASVFLSALEHRAAQPAIARSKHHLTGDSCVACGGVDDTQIGLCSSCRRAPSDSDVLIFARRSTTGAERESARTTVLAMLPEETSDEDLRAVLAGQRPLARVPADAVPALLERLVRRGLPARGVPLQRSWTAIPLPMYGLFALVLGVGCTAGLVAPIFSLASPLFALLMMALVVSVTRRPLVGVPERRLALPALIEEEVRGSLTALPPGSARSLLTDIVRLAEPALAAGPSSSEREREEIVALLRASCDAAGDLARLDESLRVLEGQRERAVGSERWHDATARCARARDRLAQRLLDALTVLGDASARATGRRGAESRLAEMTRELDETARVEAEAAAEVEQLLGNSTRTRD